MAINETLTITGKRIPTGIAFIGYNLDLGTGGIELAHAIRRDDGSLIDEGKNTYNIQTELAFVDSTGITGADVMQYLAEWFEHKMGK